MADIAGEMMREDMSELEVRTHEEMRDLEARAAMADELARACRLMVAGQWGTANNLAKSAIVKYNAIKGARK